MKIIKPHNQIKTVGIIAPSEPITSQKIFLRGIKILKQLGWQVITAEHIFSHKGFYEAGDYKNRVEDFHKMIINPKIDAIFCARGGFLAIELLSSINYNLIRKNPKIIMGWSDITTLSNTIFAKTGLITFHGPNVEGLIESATPYTIKSLQKLFKKGEIQFEHKSHWQSFKKGHAYGRLIGGNLTCLTDLLGTPYSPSFKDVILFLEDHGADFEDIEHNITQLKLASVFKGVKGIILGKFDDTKIINNAREFAHFKKQRYLTLHYIFTRHLLLDYSHIPILANVDFGNVNDMLTIPIGAKAFIDTRRKPYIFRLKENPFKD